MYTQVCACICCVVMCIDQGDSVASLPCFSRSRCLCCAWWRWTSITSSSQTSLPGDVTTVVPPFNHPIAQPYTPPTSLDEARQSYHLIGYFIRHLQRLKQSCVLTRESFVSSVLMSATALKLGVARTHVWDRRHWMLGYTWAWILFSQPIISFKHTLSKFSLC